MRPIVRDASREIEAARVLREHIAQLAAGDEDFIRDTLEGEVDLDATVRALVASIGEDEALVAGISGYVTDLADRRDRIKDRIGAKRALVASALEIAGRPKIEMDLATVSLTKVQPKAIVSEEAEIPSEFWRPQPPKLDLKALGAALKDGRTVPGASLSNGGVTATIRRK